jgi:hypothetical protein
MPVNRQRQPATQCILDGLGLQTSANRKQISVKTHDLPGVVPVDYSGSPNREPPRPSEDEVLDTLIVNRSEVGDFHD